MGPDGIVVHAPGLDDLARVRQAEEPVLVQALVAESAVETLDVGILIRLARVDEVQPDAAAVGPMNSGPLSVINTAGVPRVSTSRWRTSTTRREPIEVSTSIAKQARVKSSTTAKSRTRRPSSRARARSPATSAR